MTLRNLRIFLAVADCGSMSEAAKKMHIAQPSVSGTISEIEEQYQAGQTAVYHADRRAAV